jgi:hypothetical protein
MRRDFDLYSFTVTRTQNKLIHLIAVTGLFYLAPA